MYAAERSVVVSLAQANAMAETHSPDQVGVVIDVFHVWWDLDLDRQIAQAADRILGFHISDWIVPTPDLLMVRGMMGDGVIEISRIRESLETAGYRGPIEVEIFNQAIWDAPGDEELALMKRRFLEHV